MRPEKRGIFPKKTERAECFKGMKSPGFTCSSSSGVISNEPLRISRETEILAACSSEISGLGNWEKCLRQAEQKGAERKRTAQPGGSCSRISSRSKKPSSSSSGIASERVMVKSWKGDWRLKISS